MSKLRSQLDNLTAPPSYAQTDMDNQQPDRLAVSREIRNDENRLKLAGIKSAMRDLVGKSKAAENQNQSRAPLKASPQQTNPNQVNTQAPVDNLSQSLREDLRQQITSEIDKMRSELDTLKLSANESNDRAILDDIQQISASIQELQNQQSKSQDQFGELAGELRGIHSNIQSISDNNQHALDPQEISNIIQSSYNEIAKKLDSLGTSQAGDHIELLIEKLETFKENIPSTDPQALLKIESHLSALGDGISALSKDDLINIDGEESNGSIDAKLLEYFESLEGRLDEITRAVVASASIDNGTGDGEVFERIEARIGALAKSVDNLSLDTIQSSENPQMVNLMRMPEQLQATLGRLEERITELSMSPEGEEPRIDENFGAQLAALTHKIDQMHSASDVPNAANKADFGADIGYGAKLDLLSQTLERAINSGDGSIAQIENQINELSKRIDDAVSADLNENRIIEELQALVARVESIEPAEQNVQSHLGQLSGLENQMASIASQLQSIDGQPDLSSIESRLGGIEEQFVATKDVAIEAASYAIEHAVSMNENENQAELISSLAQELKNISRSSAELQGNSSETFDAVRQSLSMILDRVNSIESRMTTEESHLGDLHSAQPHQTQTHNSELAAAAREYASSLTRQNDALRYDEAATSSAGDERGETGEHSHSGQYFPQGMDLPPVDAPSMDMQDLPETEEAGDQHLDQQIAGNDLPLEPGSGAPDMDALMRKAKENRRSRVLEDQQQNPTDFIGAARRAAQAAAEEAQQISQAEEDGVDDGKAANQSGIKNFLVRKKKLMMFGAAALILAMLAVPASKMLPFFSSDPANNTQQAENIEPAKPVEQSPLVIIDKKEVDIAASETSPTKAKNADELPSAKPVQIKIEKPGTDRKLPVQTATQNKPSTKKEQIVSLEAASENITTSELPRQQASVIPVPNDDIGPIALRQAAASGNPDALFEIGRRYTDGINGIPDYGEAAKWYELAAKTNHAPAQYRLGNFNEKGHSGDRDVDKAAQWYRLAAKQGNTLAMHNLAVINAMGVLSDGVNMSEAAVWFQKAADHGVKDSQVNLGIIHAKAMGVKLDLPKAYKWFAVAAKAGDKDAAQKRDTIAKQLKPDQLEQMRGEVELWKPQQLNQKANSIEVRAEWKLAPQVTASLTSAAMIQKTQAILTKLGFKPGSADGLMGEKTIRAIKEFQKRAGIAVDGKISPDLITALEIAAS